MKKIVFVLSMMIFGSMSLMAQEATKAKECTKGAAAKCCASKAKTASTASVDTKVLSAALSLAETDATITKRVCAESGSTAFYKKAVCETSGKISYNEVQYDEAKMQFVNVSPNDIGDANEGKMYNVVNKTDVNSQTATKAVAADGTGEKVMKKACSSKKEGAKCCAKGTASADKGTTTAVNSASMEKGVTKAACSSKKEGAKCCAKGKGAKKVENK